MRRKITSRPLARIVSYSSLKCHSDEAAPSLNVDRAALGMRWEGLTSLMKPSVVKNAKRASAKGVKGNLKGEGRLLGGLLVVGGDGIAFEHREAVSKDSCRTQIKPFNYFSGTRLKRFGASCSGSRRLDGPMWKSNSFKVAARCISRDYG